MDIGNRLKYAREMAGLTLETVAEKTRIGVSSLSDYENGKREPKIRLLQELGKVYMRSLSFFLSEDSFPRELILWRKKPETPVAEEVEGKFRRLCEQYHNLEMWCNDTKPYRIYREVGSAEIYGYGDAEHLASEIRKQLQLGERPAMSLLQVLEEVCHIKVFHLDFQPTGCAACSVSDSYGMAILLNRNSVRWRRNFDLAHELFHLLTWDIFREGCDGMVDFPNEKEEKLATCFARNLLMPLEVIKGVVNSVLQKGKVEYSVLFSIARQFDVSTEALLWHLHFLYQREEEKTETDIKTCHVLSSIYEDRLHDDSPPVLPERFCALAITALRSGEMSVGRFAEYMMMSRREAQRFVEKESAENEEVEITPA